MFNIIPKNKFINILILILILEMFLGGSGKIFNLPIRITILIFSILGTLIYLYNNKVNIPKSIIISILILWSYCFIWVLIGILSGNGIINALNDVTNFFALIYVVIIGIFTQNKKQSFLKIIDLLKYSMLILSIITIFLFFGSYFGRYFNINVGMLLEKFNDKTNYGLITGALYNFKFARVYFMNGIFMQVSLVFFVYDILNKNRKKDYIFTCIMLLGIFSSSTRGYWLGAVVVILMLLIMTNKKQKNNLIKILIFMIIFFIPIFFTPFFKSEIVNRVNSITDFSKDPSNQIRTIQINCMISKIKEKPLIGSGFGANLQEYTESTGLSGRHFEVYYLELIYKTGIIGISILVILLFMIIYFSIKKIILDLNKKESDKDIIKALIISLASSLITGITNPYMQGTIGIFIIVLIILGYFSIEKNIQMITIGDFKSIIFKMKK